MKPIVRMYVRTYWNTRNECRRHCRKSRLPTKMILLGPSGGHCLLLLLVAAVGTHGFVPVAQKSIPLLLNAVVPSTRAVPTEQVEIWADASAVGARIRALVKESATEAIQARGAFALAIPGGSVLKMLVGSGSGDGTNTSNNNDDSGWTKKTTLAYVNHKCVAMDDANLATHAKARKLFLDDGWPGCHTIVLAGTDQGPAEAASYEAKLRALPANILPVVNGLPVFDLVLVGVGDDGHIGSLYPGRDEALVGPDGPWVLPVEMKQPPSITLSLPVIKAAKKIVIAACGVSDKYPQGKSDGMRRAIVDEAETVATFPVVGLRDVTTWVLDEAAASKLGEAYRNPHPERMSQN
jgi:6-phosphogluconolactonase